MVVFYNQEMLGLMRNYLSLRRTKTFIIIQFKILLLKTIADPVELWQTTYDWLQQTGNKTNKNYCRQELTTHPDYPAMTAITDFLDAGNMPYNAVRADDSYIHEFNYPALAHIRLAGQEFMHIVAHATDWDKQKEITQHWTGNTLFPEKDAKWVDQENNNYQHQAQQQKLIITALIIVGLGVFVFSSFYVDSTLTILFGLFSLVGLIISILLLSTELGFQSQIVKQVCGSVSNGGCEKVLKSRYAKGFLGITPADASIVYFSSQFIIYLLSIYQSHLLPFLFLLSLFGVAIVAWSIYTQAFKLKQWCALCLGTAGILFLQALVSFLILDYQFLTTSPIYPALVYFMLAGILLLGLHPIKQLIKTNKSNQQKLAELKKWKTDAQLFITQWQQEQRVDTSIWENDLLLGNPEAPLLITVACNPYCGPCAKAHEQLDGMLEKFEGKIAVQIRFLCNPKNEKDQRTIAVKAILLQAAVLSDRQAIQQMLTDWFVWMNYDKWSSKWPFKESTQVHDVMNRHADWVDESNIAFTPTFFLNGKKIPGRYDLKDLELLIPQLAETIKLQALK